MTKGKLRALLIAFSFPWVVWVSIVGLISFVVWELPQPLLTWPEARGLTVLGGVFSTLSAIFTDRYGR